MDDEIELLSVADIARTLKIPESTVRHYRDRFFAYVPVMGSGRARKHPIEAMEVFSVIAHQSKAGAKHQDIEAVLENVVGNVAKKKRSHADMSEVQNNLEQIRQELRTVFDKVEESANVQKVSDLLTVSDFTNGLEERFSVVFKEIDVLKEQFNFVLGEFSLANKKLDEISKLMQNQRDRELTSSLRRDKEKPHGWFKRQT